MSYIVRNAVPRFLKFPRPCGEVASRPIDKRIVLRYEPKSPLSAACMLEVEASSMSRLPSLHKPETANPDIHVALANSLSSTLGYSQVQEPSSPDPEAIFSMSECAYVNVLPRGLAVVPKTGVTALTLQCTTEGYLLVREFVGVLSDTLSLRFISSSRSRIRLCAGDSILNKVAAKWKQNLLIDLV